MNDRSLHTTDDLDGIDFEKGDGLLPVIAQDARDGAVLMVAYANRRALEASLDSRRMHYWSRSRQELWRKGDTSGAAQQLISMHADCDSDVVLARVLQEGAACHTGDATCFGAGSIPESSSYTVFQHLDATLASRADTRPEGSYTARLLDDENLRLKKLGEETVELTTALARGEAQAVNEAADLLFHVMVALRASGHSLADVAEVLKRRTR
jgi:phosphoribosyl-ATP pyrophosphohydrolase/phosphoribosyl-AMP cyclohydrolase